MGCKAVPQNVRGNFFAYSGFLSGITYDLLNSPFIIFLAKIGKENKSFSLQIEILNKAFQLFMKKYHSFLIPFGSLKVDCAPLKVNIFPFQRGTIHLKTAKGDKER